MLKPPHADTPSTIGPYRVLARLGAGGMGEVYLGADTRPATAGESGPRLAAVKTVRTDLSGAADFRDRFRREIATARAVESRFAARVLAGDADAARPWLATEYVAGPTLERAVRAHGPLPVPAVRRLGHDLARALRAVHHARVLHRDLKPANVLLAADGARVIDFGIARDFGASTLTGTGAMVGSPGFMSPEHLLGGRHVVAASDVFCLASVLCFAATGESPFGGGPVAAVLYRISQGEAQLADVPEELRPVLEDCLRLDPGARPGAADLEARLRTPEPEAPWPQDVRALVTSYEDELARVVAEAGPLAPHVPTMPGASPVHSADTVTGPPPRPLAPPRAPAPKRRARTYLAVGAAAVAVGVLGAFGILALQEEGEPAARPGAGGEREPSGGETVRTADASVGETGPDRTRYFPVDPADRPEGWKPWTAKMKNRPWSCGLTREVLVCRTFHGGLEAVDAADGSLRWTAPSPVDEQPGPSANEGMYIPGKGTNPVVHGDTVVTAEAGRVVGRSVRDGSVRWRHSLGKGSSVEGEALLRDGVVVVSSKGDGGTRVRAHEARSGKLLWDRIVSTYDGPTAGYRRYAAYGFAGDRVLSGTDGGLTGFDLRSGKPTPFSLPGGKECVGALVTSGEVRCQTGEKEMVVLDEETLKVVGEDRPLGASLEQIVPVGDKEYVLTQDGTRDEVRLAELQGDTPGEWRTVGPLVDVDAYLPVTSQPAVVGSTAVFLDNAFLHMLPLEGGAPKKYEVKGAPGNDAGGGFAGDVDSQVWAPELLSLGGLLYLVYHDGTVRSLEPPS